jgi:formate-dependent nitrite reductase membrane component NrfD
MTTERATGRRSGRGRGRGEQLVVPPAEFTSYYGRPILKPPTWEALDVAGYLFFGGLAGGSSLLAAGAERTERAALARSSKVTALGAIALSTVALVHDLGRPARFVNMLRVFKPTSPMSVGSWLLAAYGPSVGLAALTDVTGRVKPVGRAASTGAAVLGPAVAAYTSVLIANTAVPAWHDARQELPFLFVGSAASAAAGAAMVMAPHSEQTPARRLAVLGSALEVAAESRLARAGRIERRSYGEGKAAGLLKAGRGLAITGALIAGTVGRRSAWASRLAGAALVAGSAATRFGIFEAGVASSADPEQVVAPQRARLLAEAERGAT